eukprot:12171532-Alexandrium_andersonii.AAC.1
MTGVGSKCCPRKGMSNTDMREAAPSCGPTDLKLRHAAATADRHSHARLTTSQAPREETEPTPRLSLIHI